VFRSNPSNSPDLAWDHNTDPADAISRIKQALAERGYGDAVHWKGSTAKVTVGPWGTLFHALGEVTARHIIIHDARGVLKQRVLSETRDMLRMLFPPTNHP
jgi:hypothetical protein